MPWPDIWKYASQALYKVTLRLWAGALLDRMLLFRVIVSKTENTVYREIFADKKCSRLSVTAKITHTKFFQQQNTVTVFLIQELRFVVILNIILDNCCSKSRIGRSHLYCIQWETWPYRQYSLTVRAKIGKYTCHHGVTAPVAASHECTSLFLTPAYFLHVLNFRGRPLARKFYSMKFFHANLL